MGIVPMLIIDTLCCCSVVTATARVRQPSFAMPSRSYFLNSIEPFNSTGYGVDYFYRNWDTIRVAAAYGYDCTTVPVVTPDMSAVRFLCLCVAFLWLASLWSVISTLQLASSHLASRYFSLIHAAGGRRRGPIVHRHLQRRQVPD